MKRRVCLYCVYPPICHAATIAPPPGNTQLMSYFQLPTATPIRRCMQATIISDRDLLQSFNDLERHQFQVNRTVKVLISQNVFYFETLSVFTEGVTSYSARAADVDGTKTISHLTEFLSSHSRFVRRLETGAWTLAVTASRNIPKRLRWLH